MVIDRASAWRPYGGEVKFTVSGPGFDPATNLIVTCFKWSAPPSAVNPWIEVPAVRVPNKDDPATATFSATVPNLRKSPGNWWDRVTGKSQLGFTALALVPLADFRVIATTPAPSAPTAAAPSASTTPGASAPTMDVIKNIGYTSGLFAGLAAVAVMVLAGLALWAMGCARRIPGGANPILQLISTKGGYASLSQLQIMLWAFVVGGSAVYVMVLSGNLIDITQGTLVLLGISGVAALGSKIQSGAETAPPAPVPPPGKVGALRTNEPPGESDIRLTWTVPPSGGPPDVYCVQYRITNATTPADWTTATSALEQTGFRITGLTPNTPYDIQVFGLNAGGPGEVSSSLQLQTAATSAAAIGPVADLTLQAPAGAKKICVQWPALANAGGYLAQYRRHDSDDGWSQASVAGCTASLVQLEANTLYDVRVAAAAPSATNVPPVFGNWRSIAVATTGPRLPRWSDLVIESDGANEIDVTRVQMLFFTVIVAGFVAMRVVASGEIPTIPDSFLLLMGISNGVYLGSKFIRS